MQHQKVIIATEMDPKSFEAQLEDKNIKILFTFFLIIWNRISVSGELSGIHVYVCHLNQYITPESSAALRSFWQKPEEVDKKAFVIYWNHFVHR